MDNFTMAIKLRTPLTLHLSPLTGTVIGARIFLADLLWDVDL